MSRCDVGSKSDEPCMGTAGYEARSHRTYAWADGLALCEDHARGAVNDGSTVTSMATGDEMRVDDDGELVSS